MHIQKDIDTDTGLVIDTDNVLLSYTPDISTPVGL